ncbi:(2Fe-2S)-binding protein, partial [Shewanella sp. D64]
MKKITIDGKRLTVSPQATLFDIAKSAGITIPNLCHQHSDASFSTNNNQKSHCNLCQVEVHISGIHQQGKPVIVRACDTQLNSLYSSDEQTVKVITQSAQLSLLRQTALTEILSDHFADCEAPCQQACPAGVDVQSYLFHIAQGNHREAIKV